MGVINSHNPPGPYLPNKVCGKCGGTIYASCCIPGMGIQYSFHICCPCVGNIREGLSDKEKEELK